MNFNIRAPKTIRVEPRCRFSLDSKIGIPTSELWETLIAIVDKFDKDASSKLNQIKDDSITAFNYGLSLANLIDHHGLAIREQEVLRKSDVAPAAVDARMSILSSSTPKWGA